MVTSVCLLLLVDICGRRIIDLGRIKKYFLWYGLFCILIVASLTYTINKKDPEYVINRIFVVFLFALILVYYVRDHEDFVVMASGFIIGALAVGIIALIVEGYRIGTSRMGQYTCGSAIALSGILTPGAYCALWKTIYIKERKAISAVFSVALFILIVLTGSRRAIILCLLFLLALIFLKQDVKLGKKFLYLLIACMIISLFIYLIFTNETFYDVLGRRLDSMLMTLESDSDVEDKSMATRDMLRSYSFELFRERPILGYGVHGFSYMNLINNGSNLTSHNGLGEVLSCYGLVGFVLFYRVYIPYIRNIKFLFKPQNSAQVFFVLYAIFTLLSDGYTSAPFRLLPLISLLGVGLNLMDCNDRSQLHLEKRLT